MQDSPLLRIADRQLGSLLCGGISLLRSFSPRPASSPPRKILLVELFEMGAAVMLLPSIKEIKRRFPEAEVHCLTTQSCLPVWSALGVIEPGKLHVMSSNSASEFVLSFAKTVWKLRKIHFDLVIDYELFMRIPAILSGLLKAKQRGGFYKYDFEGLYRGNFYHHISAYNQNAHISKNFLGLTRTALENAKDSPNHKNAILPADLIFSPAYSRPVPAELMRIFGRDSLFKYIVLCVDVGKTLAMRNYPRRSFAEFVRNFLLAHDDFQAIFVGTAEDSVASAEVISLSGVADRCLNLAGKTNFEDLLKVIGGAELVVTNDNGPAHFAALTGTKTLAIFSTDSPFVYGPLGDCVIAYANYHCSPCISAYNHKVSRCDNNRCVQAIPPGQLMELASGLLAGTTPIRTINGQVPYLF